MIAHAVHHPFEAKEELALCRAAVKMQHPAMWRIKPRDAIARQAQGRAEDPRQRAALGPVPMPNVGPQLPDEAIGAQARGKIAGADAAPDWNAGHPKRQRTGHGLEIAVLQRTASGGIADEADLMACGCLRHGKIADMAEDAADRST